MNVVTSLVFHDTSHRLIFTSVLSRWSFFFGSSECKWTALCLCISSTDGAWWSGLSDRIASVFECVRIYICVFVLRWVLMTVGIWPLSVDR